MCDEPAILEVFEKGLDPYVAFSVHTVGGTYEKRWAEYKAGNKRNRTLNKPPVLGCGYRLSAGIEFENEQTGEIEGTGLLGYAMNMGVKMTPAEATHAVTVWREAHPNVCEYWNEIEWAAKHCIRTEQPQTAKWVTFDRSGPFMRMRLPSGRHLHYCRPRIENLPTPWGKIRATITYEQLDDKNRWTRTKTQGGKLVENGDQAISRDLLAHGMKLARAKGIFIRLHVHDQIVGMVRKENSEKALRILLDCMRAVPEWGPGLPLDAAGTVSDLFLKD
jgi:DNA polymerase